MEEEERARSEKEKQRKREREQQPIFKMQESDLEAMHINPSKLRGLTMNKDKEILLNQEAASQILKIAQN